MAATYSSLLGVIALKVSNHIGSVPPFGFHPQIDESQVDLREQNSTWRACHSQLPVQLFYIVRVAVHICTCEIIYILYIIVLITYDAISLIGVLGFVESDKR